MLRGKENENHKMLNKTTTESGKEPGQGWSQGKIHPKGIHKV